MNVTVEYAAQLKRAAGIASETIEIDVPCTLQDLISNLANKHDDSLRNLLFDSDGNLQRSILVFVGDHQVRWDEQLELKDSDVVTLLPPISGG